MNKRWLLAVAGAFFITSCGFKAPPVPPETVVPMAIKDLRYGVDADSTIFTWTYPTETISGSKISEIDSFELYQADMPLEEVCGNCPIPFGEPEELAGGTVFDGEIPVRGGYTVSALKSGHKYYFSLRSRLNWWAASADSNIVTFTWFTPAMAPEGFVARAGDGEVFLSWQAVDSLSDGMSLDYPISYQVQRSGDGDTFQNIGTPVSDTKYTDERVEFGKKYYYRVQSLMSYSEEKIQGLYTEKVSAVPVDLIAPPTPKGLQLYNLASGHKLIWDGVNVPDVAGYIVYSRSLNGKLKELARVDAPITTYTDTRRLRVQYYAVTAIDNANPPNESPVSREVNIR
ncbi:MAG: hypothetical protein OCC45_04245 [Desulfotalea sp.]